MSDLGRAGGALLGAIILAGVTVAGAGWARENGFLPASPQDVPPAQHATAPDADSERETTSATPYDLFIRGDNQAEALLDEINALCGFEGPIGADETRLALVGDAPGALLVHSTFGGGLAVVDRISAPADQLHAYGDGQLTIVLAEGRLNGRTFVLDDAGEPVNSDPMVLSNDAELYLACADAPGAARALNALLAERGSAGDPVQVALDDFVVEGENWPGERVGSIAAACGTGDVSTAVAGRWILDATIRRDRHWGEMVVNDFSGERPGGVDDFLYLDIAERSGFYAMITRYSIPLSEPAFYPLTESGFGPNFRWNAIAVRRFEIWSDGSRGHSEPGEPVRGVDIPCHDIAAGEEALSAVR